MSMKRGRADALVQEDKRQRTALNAAFKSWLDGASLLSTWEEGCWDYIAHGDQLRSKLAVEGGALVFGMGDMGQLGMGHEPNDVASARPKRLRGLAQTPISCLAAGGLHNAVVDARDGSVLTWGCADNGTLGRELDNHEEEGFPAVVPTLLHQKVFVVQVSAGDSHTAALSMKGEVFLWGSYLDGDGRTWFRRDSGDASFKTTQATPLAVPEFSPGGRLGNGSGATQLSSGSHHTLVLCGDGTVYSWGIGQMGQLGRKVCDVRDKKDVYQKDLVLAEHLTPRVMRYADSEEEARNARFVSAANYHSFVIQAVRSRVFACGLNQYGQLAMAAGGPKERLTHVTALDDLGVETVCGGEHHSLAVSREGDVYTFGRADSSELGVDPAKADIADAGAFLDAPQKVAFRDAHGKRAKVKVAAAACGSHWCVVATEDGCMYTWGYGDMGQLGTGKEQDEPMPVLIARSKKNDAPLKSIVAVAAGGQHTLVLLAAE